jgi:hypothetical protein
MSQHIMWHFFRNEYSPSCLDGIVAVYKQWQADTTFSGCEKRKFCKFEKSFLFTRMPVRMKGMLARRRMKISDCHLWMYRNYAQSVGPAYSFSLTVESSIRDCKILHDPVVASGSLPDMSHGAIGEHNLEPSII